MCGICGYAHPDPGFSIGKDRLIEMRDSIEHRGPDDAGLVSNAYYDWRPPRAEARTD